LGYYLQIDEDDAVPLASLVGWGDVVRWTDTLAPKDASALHHLTAFGWEDDGAALASQLKDCFAKSPPHDAPTKDTLKNFSALLAAHPGSITAVSVTDNLSEGGLLETTPSKVGHSREKAMNLSSLIPPGPFAIEPASGQHLLRSLEAIDLHVHLAENESRRVAIKSADSGAAKSADNGAAKSADNGAAPSKPRKPYQMDGSVALLSLSGPMSKAGSGSMSDGGSTVQLRRQVRQAAADPDVSAILLTIDSPGGEVAGTGDLASDVRAAAQGKPLYAYIEDLGASAAYWVASQCNAIYANPGARVGSIGTYLAVEDSSGMADNLGLKVHVLKAGDYKGAGIPGTAVTDDHLAHFQQQVNDLNSQFVSAVGRGRDKTPEQMKELSDGRMYVGAKARIAGLVEGVTSRDAVIAKLKSYKPSSK